MALSSWKALAPAQAAGGMSEEPSTGTPPAAGGGGGLARGRTHEQQAARGRRKEKPAAKSSFPRLPVDDKSLQTSLQALNHVRHMLLSTAEVAGLDVTHAQHRRGSGTASTPRGAATWAPPASKAAAAPAPAVAARSVPSSAAALTGAERQRLAKDSELEEIREGKRRADVRVTQLEKELEAVRAELMVAQQRNQRAEIERSQPRPPPPG